MNKYIKFEIKPSHINNKKYDAIFTFQDYKPLIIPFGQKGFSDFTSNHDENKKNNYLKRHQKRENWDDPYSKGALSRFILWETDNLQLNVKLFKKRFGFK
jgi:hypothetical protein